MKVLFHPGLSGGEFRAETTDEHDYFFNNEDMPFTPANDVIHEMVINVKRVEAGAQFNVAVHDGGSEPVHRHAFQVDEDQLGDYNRIGLERSGRRGANALFDSISIRLGR